MPREAEENIRLVLSFTTGFLFTKWTKMLAMMGDSHVESDLTYIQLQVAVSFA